MEQDKESDMKNKEQRIHPTQNQLSLQMAFY